MRPKTRIQQLEDESEDITPGEHLRMLGQQWREATTSLKEDEALKIRKEAESIFDEFPQYREKPPKLTRKVLYIDWQCFVRFDEKPWRKGYMKAIRDNQWPPRPIKE